MALFEKKQELSKGIRKKPSSRPYIRREELRQELRSEEAFKVLRISGKEKRTKLETELLPEKKFGPFIDRKDLEVVIKQLKKQEFLERNLSKKWEIKRKIQEFENIKRKYFGG